MSPEFVLGLLDWDCMLLFHFVIFYLDSHGWPGNLLMQYSGMLHWTELDSSNIYVASQGAPLNYDTGACALMGGAPNLQDWLSSLVNPWRMALELWAKKSALALWLKNLDRHSSNQLHLDAEAEVGFSVQLVETPAQNVFICFLWCS